MNRNTNTIPNIPTSIPISFNFNKNNFLLPKIDDAPPFFPPINPDKTLFVSPFPFNILFTPCDFSSIESLLGSSSFFGKLFKPSV